ncbi:MAG: hypothetical protein E7282_07405 [Lachnospiraceae bacterium]|nr:hypothetical protein [Lachnospiraceae bacterium]
MEIRELPVFSVKIEREKIAKDAKAIIRIFQLLENEKIPCECIAINIDWISITILQTFRKNFPGFLYHLGLEFDGINVIMDNEFLLLSVEGVEFTSRKVGYYMTALMFHGIYPHIMRQMNDNRKLVVGIDTDCKDMAIKLIAESELLVEKSA